MYMSKFRKKTKAIISTDMVVAMVVFLLMLSVAFYYLSYLAKPKQPFEATLNAESALISEKLLNNLTWTVYKLPVWVDSKVTGNTSFELYFQPDSEIDITSIAIQNSDYVEIPSSFFDNQIEWVSNVSAGKNLFYLTYLKNTALGSHFYNTDLMGSEN